jgi:hypothetical protein
MALQESYLAISVVEFVNVDDKVYAQDAAVITQAVPLYVQVSSHVLQAS